MKGDFTRFTHDPRKHYTRVLKQQGRVDVDADWNELAEILTHLDRTKTIDVIGRCGVPEHSDGFQVELVAGALKISPGRLYVDGILCSLEADQPVPIDDQPDLPNYSLPDEDGVYIAFADVWERHITYVEDPEIREIALGGPDTTTRIRTICQVKLHRIGDGEIEEFDCEPFPAIPNTGRLAARTEPSDEPSSPCVVPARAGYRGLENRLYRVEIHDDGRDEDGVQVRTPTFKWSRDDGSVVLPIVSIDENQVTVRRLGRDEVLTVKNEQWVEINGDETDLSGGPGTLARVQAVDPDDLEVTLTDIQGSGDLTDHAPETHLKLRRWDHAATDDVALQDGAIPIQGDWFELEDGVQVKFDVGAHYDVGDYWVIPARTLEGDVLWPREGGGPDELPRLGVAHHYCTLALVRRSGGAWETPRDCRPKFPPLTEVGDGSCCLRVEPGDDIQQAIDTVVGEGGGSVCLCHGVHHVVGPLWLRDARNVRIGGEGAATVLHLRANENLSGGLMIESSERITIESMFIASDDVPALIAVRHNEDAELNRTLAFRRLTLLNRTTSNAQTSLPCGIRLGHASGVLIDECRIAAETGVLSLWGNRLPDLDEPGDESPGESSIAVDFEELVVDDEFRVDESFTDSGVTVTGETFYWSSGQGTDQGVTRVESGGRAGGSGNELQVNNINLNFGITGAYQSVRVAFGDFGGNTNLRVNGELRNTNGLALLDGETIGGVRVSVTQTLLELDADTAAIEEFAIGGQELWIDNVTFLGGEEPQPPAHELDYGYGVTALRMQHTQIRFEDFGTFSCLSQGWTIEGCDIRPLEHETWEVLAKLLPTAVGDGTLPRFAPVLSGLEDLFAETDLTGRGIAIAAFLWRDSNVCESRLAGSHGIHVWWWVGGTAAANEVDATETGLFAMWLHAVDWRHNRVTCDSGIAMGFVGCHRVGVEANRLRGTVGVTTVSFTTSLSTLAILTGAVARSYGQAGDGATLAVLWVFIEETMSLMGLRDLNAALQSWVEVNQHTTTPVSVIIAERLRELLSDLPDREGASVPLPVIHLRIVGNDIVAERHCVALDDFLALGSIVLLGNRLHTITGQAVRLEADGLGANGHMVVFLFRAVLALVRERIDEALAQADGQGNDPELTEVFRVVGELLARWQAGAETFFELDFRIEGNTIRSLLTAIEFNLFEVAVLDNHITLQERPVRGVTVESTASVFGVVTGPRGAAITGAAVRVTGNGVDRSTTTDAKATYRVSGRPAGTYAIRASQTGYRPATSTVTLSEGEQIEQDFQLSLWQFTTGRAMRTNEVASGDVVVAKQRYIRAGSNPEIASIIAELERSEALEPLAEAMRDGAHADTRQYSNYLRGEGGPLNTAEAREDAASAVVAVAGLTSDPETDQLSRDLGDALRQNDRTELESLLPTFIAAMLGLVDTRGILARGIGCRIIGNQVLVPADVRPETESMGGIQISVSYLELYIALVLGKLLLGAIGDADDNEEQFTDPLLGVTDTLVDNNEVSGGVGHGVSVQGVAGFPDAIPDLRIRNNQIRGMAGAGILSNEHAYVVGAEIVRNHVAECGRAAGFGRVKGGIIMNTATVCEISGNHVERCGTGEDSIDVFGIEVDTVYGARLMGNEVLANGPENSSTDSGGMQLLETYGAVAVHDNLIAFNRGRGLTWINSARPDDDALVPDALMNLANQYLRTSKKADGLSDEEQATVQDNILKADNPGVPLFNMLNLTELTFSGNTCRSESADVPLGEIQSVTRGVITNNLLNSAAVETISVKKLTAGVILGNVGNKPIGTKTIGADVESGFNVPPIS